MKKAVFTLLLILALLFFEMSGAKIVKGEDANFEQTQPQIMSFEEAIEAAKTGNYSGEEYVSSYIITSEPEGEIFVDGEGISGFLMWLAPNGTFYEAEYPIGTALGEIGNTLGESVFNPPDGYYLWGLNFGSDGGEYWILANNGTIFLYNSPRGSGPAPTPPPFPQVIVY
jgi:hypothetical protein